jgi:carboxyl-terminal processing protease
VTQVFAALALALVVLGVSGQPGLSQPSVKQASVTQAMESLPRAAPKFDEALDARVFAAALAFTAPRTLDAVTPATLTLWGLGGIEALDPTMTVAARGGFVNLIDDGRVVAAHRAPPAGDTAAWGRLAAAMNGEAFAFSSRLREAGGPAAVQSFFDEMFNHLDPYSRYVPPAPAELARDRLSVDAGVGISLVRQKVGQKSGQKTELIVSGVAPGGPAAEAGVRVGDRLLSVDGIALRRRSLNDVQALLTGQEGDARKLKVRGLDGILRVLPVNLAYVPPETVFTTRADGLLVLRVSEFDGNTAERLSQAIEAGMAEKPAPAAMVIDLRGNRGGLLRQAVTAVALFAEQGIIASTAGRDPQATHDWRIDGGGDLTHNIMLLVLVDGRTASAAEIMAAGLADLGRAVVIGSSTLGKGLVQTITTLPDGGELYVTWSRVLAPRLWPIQMLGVMPQICTSRGDAALHHELDDLADGHNDMEKAVEMTRAARPPLASAEALALRQPCPAAGASDLDMEAAQFLAKHPPAYQAALIR